MGCTSSSEDEDHDENLKNKTKSFATSPPSPPKQITGGEDTPEEELTEEDKVLENLCVQWMEEFGAIKFPSLIAGKRLWYLDEFRPKGSKEKIKMWKEAVIDILDPSHDCIHLKLSPINKVRERMVDLKSDWGLLALPAMNLSKEQRIKGGPLTDEQLEKSWTLLTAEYTYDDDIHERIRNGQLLNKNGENGTVLHHYEYDHDENGFHEMDFSIGKEVDVQDVYLSPERKEIQSKWRKAKIIAINDDSIRVHYVGLDDRWDENINLSRDANRIKPGGTMTALMHVKNPGNAGPGENRDKSIRPSVVGSTSAASGSVGVTASASSSAMKSGTDVKARSRSSSFLGLGSGSLSFFGGSSTSGGRRMTGSVMNSSFVAGERPSILFPRRESEFARNNGHY